MPAPRLTDGIVVLDAFTLDDVPAHLAGEDEEHARRFGWHPVSSTEEGVRRAVLRWEEEWRVEGGTRAFAVRRPPGRALVGGCEIRLRKHRICEISYWIVPVHRRRGFATRALRLASEFAFTGLGVERIELYVEADNDASRGVARSAGFTEEGTLRSQELTASGERRDMVLYARLATD